MHGQLYELQHHASTRTNGGRQKQVQLKRTQIIRARDDAASLPN